MILTGLGAYYVTEQLRLFSIANLTLGPLLVLAGVGITLRRFRGFTGAHSRRVVLKWGAIGVAVLIAVIVVNVLGMFWDTTIDLTAERRYTLADQTLQACDQLRARGGEEPLQLFLITDALIARDVRPLVRAYRNACPDLEVTQSRAKDAPPETHPVFQTMDATVIVCYAGRCEGDGFPSEENITNALVRLFRDRDIQVHFLVGHGEADLASARGQGFSDLTGLLRNEGLHLEALVGPATEEVPRTADVLIVASPERDLLPPEVEALNAYLQGGGRLLAMLEPGVATNLETLLERWGFELPPGVFVDPASSPLLEDPRPVSLLVNAFNPYHPVTRKLSRRTMLLLPGARAVLPVRKPQPQDDVVALTYTSRRAWLEKDVKGALAGRAVAQDPGELGSQELPLAAAGRYPREGGEARIIVIGDRDFASNRLLRTLYNGDLIVNAVLWLAQDEGKIRVSPKLWTPDQDPLTLERTLAYFYFMGFALPELLLLLGIHAWYRQREI